MFVWAKTGYVTGNDTQGYEWREFKGHVRFLAADVQRIDEYRYENFTCCTIFLRGAHTDDHFMVYASADEVESNIQKQIGVSNV